MGWDRIGDKKLLIHYIEQALALLLSTFIYVCKFPQENPPCAMPITVERDAH
jgi:hypothetical protein